MQPLLDRSDGVPAPEDDAATHMLRMAVATILAFGATDRFLKLIWTKGHPNRHEGFRSTFLYGATISARVYLSFVVLDLALQFARTSSAVPQALLDAFLPKAARSISLSKVAPPIAGFIWAGLSICTIKRVLLLQSVSGKKLGRVVLFDRLLDWLIMAVTMVNILDILDIDLSTGLQSILSMGGVGALVFSLASKDLAENVVGGFALNAWDAFSVGDIVMLGDGTEGTVQEVGLIETHIKGHDNIVTRIPNGQLTTARVSNLSRLERSRCFQTLRFKYKDLDKLEEVLRDIKLEIKQACPKTITDGSAAFFAVLEEYKADHISALVIANFEINPRSLEFFENRQQFVLAIARAMKKHHVEFAIPSIQYNTIAVSN